MEKNPKNCPGISSVPRNTSLDFEQKMTPWTMGLNILYGIGIAAIFGLSIVLEQSGVLSLAYVLGVLLICI